MWVPGPGYVAQVTFAGGVGGMVALGPVAPGALVERLELVAELQLAAAATDQVAIQAVLGGSRELTIPALQAGRSLVAFSEVAADGVPQLLFGSVGSLAQRYTLPVGVIIDSGEAYVLVSVTPDAAVVGNVMASLFTLVRDDSGCDVLRP